MLVNAKFPVFVDGASVPGYRLPRPVIHVADTIVDVAETTSEAVPIALRTHRVSPNGKQELARDFRHKDGEFYRQIWESGESWLTTILSNPMNRMCKIGLGLSRQAAMAQKAGHARRILPAGILQDILTYSSSVGDFGKFFQERGPNIVVPPDAEEAIVKAGEAYHRACQDFLLIDGELWEKCPEPVISVDVNFRPGHIACLSTTFLPSESFSGTTCRPQLDEVIFPVLEHAEARALADQSFDRSMPWRSKEFVLDIAMPEAFSSELPSSEIIGQLDHCRRVHDDKKTRQRLDAFLADPSGWTEDRLQDEVENALATQMQMWRLSAVVHQQARFDRKAIHIPMTGTAALKMAM